MKSFSTNKIFNLSKKHLLLNCKQNQNILIKNHLRFFGGSHHHEVTGEVDMEKVYVKNPKEVRIIKINLINSPFQ